MLHGIEVVRDVRIQGSWQYREDISEMEYKVWPPSLRCSTTLITSAIPPTEATGQACFLAPLEKPFSSRSLLLWWLSMQVSADKCTK